MKEYLGCLGFLVLLALLGGASAASVFGIVFAKLVLPFLVLGAVVAALAGLAGWLARHNDDGDL